MPDDEHMLREGISLFNEGEYYESHEVWEDEWRESTGMDKDFLHGLIQTAAVYVHQKRGNPGGVRSLSKSALTYLDGIPPSYRGVDVEYLRRLNREALERAEGTLERDAILVLRKPRIEFRDE